MSSVQIQKCISDVLNLEEEEAREWNGGYLKKLVSATSTLYHSSLGKVMLKNDEEIARCHICAFIAAEKLASKHMPELEYYVDKIPMEPKKAMHLMGLFKQNLLQISPVKGIQWTPSPKKKRQSHQSSLTKSNEKFTAQDPDTLRRRLFDTPSKIQKVEHQNVLDQHMSSESPSKKSPRRKLAFEQDDDPIPMETIATTEIPQKTLQDTITTKGKISRSNQDNCLLHKKYYKTKTSEVIDLCNQFELPKEVAYQILEEFTALSSYLVCPWQLVCGLVLNCTFIVYSNRRRKDPRIDHLILSKMCTQMKTTEIEDVMECIPLVKELIVGEKWYRDLQIKHNYHDGARYQEAISMYLGSMLQPDNVLASQDQYASWRRKIEQELALKYGQE